MREWRVKLCTRLYNIPRLFWQRKCFYLISKCNLTLLTSQVNGNSYDAENAEDDKNNGYAQEDPAEAAIELPLVIATEAVLS